MPKYNEADYRRPEFSGGVPVTLCDGQEWTLPKPRIRLVPAFRPDGSIDIGGGVSFGPEHDDLLDRLFMPADAMEQIRAEFALAVNLIRANYSVPNEAFAELLVIEPDDDANKECWEEIRGFLRGTSGPKA